MQNLSEYKSEIINNSEINPYLKKLVIDIKKLLSKNYINIENIIVKYIEEYTDINFLEIKSKSRKQKYTIQRQTLAWVLEYCSFYSHEEISNIINRDQSIVVHSCNRVFEKLSIKAYGDKEYRKYIFKLLKKTYLELTEMDNFLNKKERKISIQEYKKAIYIVSLFKKQQNKLNYEKNISNMDESRNNSKPVLYHTFN